MKNRQLFILGVVALVLLALYWLLQSRSVPHRKVEWLAEVDTSQVTQVMIQYDGNTVTLARGENEWKIVDPFEYRANDRFVKTLLSKLTQLRIESEITSNKNRWKEFKVDTTGTRVSIWQGDRRDDIVLGKAATGYRQTYARRDAEDTVYLVKGNYGASFTRKPDAWRDKLIAHYKAEDVLKIQAGDFTMEREEAGDQAETQWRVTPEKGESFLADKGKANSLVNGFVRMRAYDFPPEEEVAKINWEKPDRTATVELKSGETLTYRWVREKKDSDSRYFLKLDDNPVIFRQYKGVVKPLFRSVDEMRPKKSETEKKDDGAKKGPSKVKVE